MKRVLLALLLVAGTLVAPGTTPASAEGCGGSVLVLRTLNVKAKPSKTQLERGEKFTVHMKVTRPAEEDPLGNGIHLGKPPESTPAEDVTVGISIWVGKRTYFYGVGITNEKGKADVPVTVPKDSELGWAYAAATARHWIKNDCPDILEYGDRYYQDFLEVVES